MANFTNSGRREFPSLELPASSSGGPIPTAITPDVGLGGLAKAAEGFGAQLGKMVEAAATREGEDAGARDALAGQLSPQNESTIYGAAYGKVARQAKGAAFQASMAEAMGAAYAKTPDDPEALGADLDAVRKGFASTGFVDLDLQMDGAFRVHRANLLTKAQTGQRAKIVNTAQAALVSTEATQGQLLDQTAAGASFDAVGAGRVAEAITVYTASLVQFGPPEAFMVGDMQVPADPNRSGVLAPDVIAKAALQGVAGAKRSWIINAVDKIGTPEGKRAFRDDLQARWAAKDPMLAGLDGATFDILSNHIDGEVNKAEVDERRIVNDHAQRAKDMLTAWQWGADLSGEDLVAAARASGDAGLLAQAEFYAQTPQYTKGVLKAVVAQQAGITGNTAGPGIEWVSGSGVPIEGANPVADGIRAAARAAGATEAETEYLVRNGVVESRLNPGAVNGRYSGTFQTPGGHRLPVPAQTQEALKITRDNGRMLKGVLGRDPSAAELYLAHQQGAGGAKALLTAPPEINVVTALATAYDGSEAKARAAVVQNRGDPNGTVGQFVNHVKSYFSGNAAANPWAPPPGMQPGTPAFAAWANTQEGFSSDPLEFVRGGKTRPAIANVPVLVPDAAFSQDPAELKAWGEGLRGRQSLAGVIAGTYSVPSRLLTNGERDYYKSRIEDDPRVAVGLAQASMAALGGDGARQLLRELGQGAQATTAMHIAALSANGSQAFASSAAEGLALKKEGGKLEKHEGDGLDIAFRQLRPVFAARPDFLLSARNAADAAMISDRARGVAHTPDYYAQAAIGATSWEGRRYGGLTSVNGGQIAVPSWLNGEYLKPAVKVLGAHWAARNTGPLYGNGQPVPAEVLARARLQLRPDGRYLFTNPQGVPFKGRDGRPFSADLDMTRAYVRQQLGPKAVRP